MKSSRNILVAALAAAGWLMACGADGGLSGTGISAIRGNVVAAPGTGLDVADIRVSLAQTDVATRTDAAGRFELRARENGPVELRFERERDGLFARTDVVVPAGGVLELSEVVLDPDSAEARPTRQRVEFEGFVASLDCSGGSILVVPKEDEQGTVFVVEVASTVIRDDDLPITCTDLREGDRVQVDAETSDGLTLINGELVLEDREDQPGDDDDGSGDDDPDDGDDDPDDGDDDSDDGEDDSDDGEDDSDDGDDSSGADDPDDSE